MAGGLAGDLLEAERGAVEQLQRAGDPLEEVCGAPFRRLVGRPRHPADFGHRRETVVHLRQIAVGFPRVAPRPVDAHAAFARRVFAGDVVLVVGAWRLNDGAHDWISCFVLSYLTCSARLIELAECGEISQRLEAGQEKVGAAPHGRECRQAGDLLADRPLRDLVFQRAVLVADDRVALVAELVEIPVVHPHVLRELELADQARADHERGDAALDAVVRRALPADAGRRWRRGGSCGGGSCSPPCRGDSSAGCASRAAPHSRAGPSVL